MQVVLAGAQNTTASSAVVSRPLLTPKRPIDITLRVNTRNMEVDYMAIMNQVLRQQQSTIQQLERHLQALQNARDRALRRINDENNTAANRISGSNKLKYDEKQTLSSSLQNEVGNAQSQIQTLISDAQNHLRQNFSKMNSDALSKLNTVFVELSKEQGKQISNIYQVNNEIPANIQSSWANIEKVIDEIRTKA